MGAVLLGIDIGTSACKAAAFDASGTVLAQANESYPVYYPNPGWAEQDPNDWWEAVCKSVRRLFAKGIRAADITGIGVDGQSWSAIAVDRDGVLCNTPIWMDTRAEKICKEMEAACGAEYLFTVSGNPVQPMYTMPKVLWYKKHAPQVYRNAFKILQSNSFIAYRLTGAMTQEPSQGYGWNCYRMERGEWDKELCKELGVNPSLLPDLVPCHSVVGKVTAEAARLTGLAEGTPVVAGGLDAACGTLGAGVLRPGETQEQGGQAGGMSICVDRCTADPRLILSAHVVENHWLLQGGTVGGGGTVNWFEREFGTAERAAAKANGSNSFAELDRGAEQVPPGSEGLVFLPYLAGERSPIWNPRAKGVFYGIDFSKTRAHFARAAMEGVAYSLKHNLETADEAGAHAQLLRSVGGAAKSRLWMQIKADVTGKRFEVSSSDTATALGAAMLAGVGTGVYSGFEDAAARTARTKNEYIPNPETAAAYANGYRIYRELYENLKELMSRENTHSRN